MDVHTYWISVIIFVTTHVDSVTSQLDASSLLSGSTGVLLRDIIYGVSEKGTAKGQPVDADREPVELQTPDVQELLSALESHGMNAEEGETPGAQFILSLYEKLQAGETLRQASGHRGASLREADTVRTFTASVPEVKDDDIKIAVEFSIKSLSSGEVPRLAELRIQPIRRAQGHPRSQGHHKLRVAIYDQNGERVFRSSYRSQYTHDKRTGDNVYDITPLVQDMAAMRLRNVTVKVTLNFNRNQHGARNTRSVEKVGGNKALLVVYSHDEVFLQHFKDAKKSNEKRQNLVQNFLGTNLQKSRSKRSASEKSVGPKRGLCEKKDMFVDFQQMGWGEWIVYPKRFNAYMCSGRCPSPVDQPFTPTNHAVMQSLMRLASRAARREGAGSEPLVPRPCCVPSKLYPISMLYYEYGDIVVRHHEGMIVDECGCR